MDKDLERAAITVALSEMNVRAIREYERPDFIALVDERIHVGVEITELWASPTEARLERVDGYVQQLMDGHPHHREDAKEARVVQSAQLAKLDGTRVSVGPGIVTPVPSLSRHLDLIAEAIDRKTRKYSGYVKPLHGHELVIIDRIYWGNETVQPLPCSALLTQRLRTALRLAPFQDVIILAVADDDRQHRLSLRTLGIADRFATAMEITEALWGATPPDALERLNVLALLTFAEHSKAIAFGCTMKPEAIHFGRFSVQLGAASTFSISSTYGDAPGIVVPTWPSFVPEAQRKDLTALMSSTVLKSSPSVQAFIDITSQLRESILLRRVPEA